MKLQPGTEAARAEWTLDPEVAFLNHGSFGAAPRAVLAEQQRLRERLERQPVQFFGRDLPALLDAARSSLASFLGAQAGDLVWVSNATSGVNTVLRSLRLEPGDQLLCTDHGYNACSNALRAVAERAGAEVVVARLPFPIPSTAAVTEAILGAVTSRTRLALLDHVTSPSGTILPVEALVPALQARGVQVLVDGAHAPGMLPLQLDQLGADYYTGNCHKWMCTPKGSAVLHVARQHQDVIRPLAVGHGRNAPGSAKERFRLEFDILPTQDPTPFLCIPFAIDFFERTFEGGWAGLRAANHTRALAGRKLLEGLGFTPVAPAAMLGSLAAVVLPPGRTPEDSAERVNRELIERHSVEVPVWDFPAAPARVLRISAQAYNLDSDYQRLVEALPQVLAR